MQKILFCQERTGIMRRYVLRKEEERQMTRIEHEALSVLA